ncbi:NAD(P)H-dependent oxidoreductase [Ramlibacter sp.]|uniref:NAD(P)H-dependent oxidoreductase n=1 Tax=Ramlibacter sp. TaxID=1917967 RepID=UPI003D141504
MRYFIVYAHPEPRSLNGSLKDAAVQALEQAGHEVRVSDLYAMAFKAVADAWDFPMRDAGSRLVYHRESEQAYKAGQLQPEVAREIENLLWSEVVVLQFPLWWFGPPAILKGWFDRVLVNGFAIGVPKEGTRQWLRYGEGTLAGRRGIVAVTTGGREAQFSPRGINGAIDEILFPINHGIFHYTGIQPLSPFVAFRTVRTTPQEFVQLRDRYVARLLAAGDEAPIPYRFENGGDYDEAGQLREGVAEGETGFAAHLVRTGEG